MPPVVIVKFPDTDGAVNVCPVAVVMIVPLVVGNVSVVVPDTAGEDNVTEPDVEPLKIRLAII
jgi:hypothetical protein